MFRKIHFSTAFLPLIFFVFYLHKALTFLDPDFGWHIRLGQLIIKNGVYKTDPFSYTMPSFSYIDHEWLTNILMYKTLEDGPNFLGAIFFTVLAFMAFYIPFLGKKLNSITWPLMGITLAMCYPYFGIRPQVISWFLFSFFLFSLWENGRQTTKHQYWIPILTIVWVNLHASFALVPFVLIINLVVKSLTKSYGKDVRLYIIDFAVVAICFLATGINPYGFQIWLEVWRSVSDPALRWTISEWIPSVFALNPFYLFYITLYVVLFRKAVQKFSPERVVVSVILLLQSVLGVRHIPLWAISATPLIFGCISDAVRDIEKLKLGKQRFEKFVSFVGFGTSLGFILITILAGPGLSSYAFNEEKYYPKGVVSYITANPGTGNMFSMYDWGGYLIWKIPNQRVFIDGRMPSWKNPKALDNESKNAMGDYRDVLLMKKDYEPVFEKFGIGSVLLPLSRDDEGWVPKKWLLSLLKTNSADRRFSEKLLADGWKPVYKDGSSVLYRKDFK